MKTKNKSSVLKMFNLLYEGNKSKEQILQELHIKQVTFYKNLEKLKNAGFKISKTNGIYRINEFQNVLKFDNAEKNIIAYMINTASNLLPKYKNNKFENFITRFLLLSNEDDYREVQEQYKLIKKYLLIEQYEEKIKDIEYFIAKKQKTKITLRSNRILIVKPIKFNWKKDKIELIYLKDNEEEKINLEQISKIEYPKIQEEIYNREEIIFELYGTLAKRYILKKDERVIKKRKESIVIASYIEDKEALFRRLLRYDTMCKILFPKTEKENFNKLIDKAIINIDESNE